MGARESLRFLGRASGYLALLLIAGIALLETRTLAIRRDWIVEPASIVAGEGLSYAVPSPGGRPDGSSEESTLEVLEDGRSLGPPHAYADLIRSAGHGCYRQDPTRVLFSSSDATDPRSNGRVYVLRHEWLPNPVFLAALFLVAVLANARNAARVIQSFERSRPGMLVAIVFLVALAFRVQIALRESDLTFGGHLVKGVPFSDARDWFTAASEFARNDRSAADWHLWGARRPFHYVMLGALFALTGPSIFVARVFNIVLSSLTVAVIFDLVRRVSSRPIALLAALTQALLIFDARMDLSVMTEPLGNFLAALAVWAFVRGAQFSCASVPGRRCALAFLGGGLALGLSNLARPLTLATTVGLPLAFALIAPGAGIPWRRVLASFFIFNAGFAASVGPWLIRQRVVHGIWTISENTAEAWYGATSPEYGSWCSRVGLLAGDRSIGERVAFFMEGASRNLHEHFGWYCGHVAEQLWTAIRFGGASRWVIVSACSWHLALGFAPPERGGPRRRLAMAAAITGIAFSILLPAPQIYAATFVGVVLAVALRRPIVLLVGTFVTTLFSLSMMGMGSDRRLGYGLEWMTAALAAAVVLEGLAWLETGRLPVVQLEDEDSSRRARRLAGLAGGLAVLLALAGLVRAFTLTPPQRHDPALARGPWIAAALDPETRATLEPLLDRLVAYRAHIRPGFEMPFSAQEKINQWCAIFEPRPYPFTIFEVEPAIPGGYAVFPGRLPPIEASELVLVGIPVTRTDYGASLELVAVGLAPRGPWSHPERPLAQEHARYIASVTSASTPR